MNKMSLAVALGEIEATGYLFDIGQLSPATVCALNQMVNRGELTKIKALWPYITTGIRKKTLYMAPNSVGERRRAK